MAVKAKTVSLMFAAALASAGAGAENAANPFATHAPLIESAARLIDADEIAFTETSTPAAFAKGGATAGATQAAQEHAAAALISGADFLNVRASGDPAPRKFDIAEEAPPPGWTRDGEKYVHAESGLACITGLEMKEDKGTRALALTQIVQYDDRGRDVSCNYIAEGDASVTIYASFYPEMSVEEHASSAVTAMRQYFQLKGVLPLTVVELKNKNGDPYGDEPLAGAFDVGEINGVSYKSALWLVKTHGWHVKTRATYAQNDMMTEAFAALMFTVGWISVTEKNEANPTASGPEV